MKPFEIIIHSIFIVLSIISFISMFIYSEYSSVFFFTGLTITCINAVILLAGQKYREKGV